MRLNRRKDWMLYIVFTVLGFYSHVFMFAVALSQLCTALLLWMGGGWTLRNCSIHPKAFDNFLRAFLWTAIITLLIYSPILSAFFHNMGKVRLVTVTRLPFLLDLADTMLPGFNKIAGWIAYGMLFFVGSAFMLKKDCLAFAYCMILIVLPLSLYLFINPMFVFTRYFVFALPFVLLVISQGITGLAGNLRWIYKRGVLIVTVIFLLYLQLPAIGTVLNQDRQDYREAVRYVERNIRNRRETLVFSIGYAGPHFRYYSLDITIWTPETLDELLELRELELLVEGHHPGDEHQVGGGLHAQPRRIDIRQRLALEHSHLVRPPHRF